MMEIINKALELISNNPSLNTILGIGVVGVLVLSYFYKDTISAIVLEKIKPTKKIVNLKNHNLFTSLDYVLGKVKNQEFEYPSKTEMFKVFMKCKIDTIESATLKFLDSDLDNLDKGLLLVKINELIKDDIVKVYIKETRNIFFSKGVSLEHTNKVIEIFEFWREDSVEAMQFLILSAFANEDYKTNYRLVDEALNYFSFAVRLIPRDGINSFKQLNGVFKDIKY